MGDILFLAHRIPFPPDRGDKIRSHHLLKALARLAPVHVGTFAETDDDRSCEDELGTLAETHCLVTRDKSLAWAGLEAVASGRPVSLTAFDNARLRRWVADTLIQNDIETIFVFSGQMGQYIPSDFDGRVIVDLCDVDSAKFAEYAEAATGPKRWMYRREDRLLAREEERLVALSDTTLLISGQEVELLRSRSADSLASNIRAVGNGIDAQSFDPVLIAPHPDLAENGRTNFVFTGQMDYPPNVNAVTRFANNILPAIRKSHKAEFQIVGRAPTAEVQTLASEPGVRVWGEVQDVRPFLAAADIVVAPLTIARGVQNKVLEAMAMARPIVLSPEAATGIAVQNNEHFRIAVDDNEFADAALDLLADRDAAAVMGSRARQFVLSKMSWDAVYAELAEIVSGERAGRRHAA